MSTPRYEHQVTYECLGELLRDRWTIPMSDDWRIVSVVSAANEGSNYVFVFWERVIEK